MANTLHGIKKPIEKELQEFEKYFRNSMRSSAKLLDKISYYIVKRKGKQIRPMFVFLSAKCFGEITEDTHTAAAMIELLHTASLVHDDVVDDSAYRRGFFSVNALWKNKIAVLVGDYFFSKGMLVALETKQYDILHIVSKSVKEIIEGELLQAEKARHLDIKEDIYYDIIRKKTASLIAAACSAGAHSTTKSDEIKEQMWTFGEKLGIAFQIKDDLFDYGDKEVGKPRGIDIKEKKLTLPLIHALNQSTPKEKKWAMHIIRKQNTDKKKVDELIQFVKKKGGIDYAIQKMNEYKNEAILLLDNVKDQDSKNTLIDLVEFVVERDM